MRKDLQIRIHDAGTLTPGDGTVALTLSDLVEAPQPDGQLVRPTEGTAELGRWEFRVVDTGGILTAAIANGSGRTQLLGRVIEYRERIDLGAWEAKFTGRLTALSRSPDAQAEYRVTVEDERWVERGYKPFQVADTAYLWPAGLVYPWRGFQASDRTLAGEVIEVSGNLARIRLTAQWPLGGLGQALLDWIADDLLSEPVQGRDDGAGNWTHLRALVEGEEEEVVTFGTRTAEDYLRGLQTFSVQTNNTVAVWVTTNGTWTTTPGTDVQVRFWAPTAPPSDAVPLHVGTGVFTTPTAHALGQPHPYELLEVLYTAAGVRFDSAAMAALQAEDFPPLAWRITDPDIRLDEWADEQIYAVTGVVPFRDDSGQVSPRKVWLPTADDFDVDAAYRLDASNCAEAPAWDHAASELVNSLTVEGRRYRVVGGPGRDVAYWQVAAAPPPESADYIEEGTVTLGPWAYDSAAADVSERAQTVRAFGLSSRTGTPVGFFLFGSRLEYHAARIRREIFERYGDGPQWGRIVALNSVEDADGNTPSDLLPGDIVVLDLDSWPNAATGTLGGERIVQIMSKAPRLAVTEFDVLDVGPSLQPLTAPTVSLAAGTNVYHEVVATIASVPAGATATLEVDTGDGTYSRVLTGLGNGAVTISGLPSGTTISARARSVAPGRTRSSLSSVGTQATTALTAPTVGTPVVSGLRVTLPWSGGTSGYDLVPVYRVNGSGTWLEATSLAAGSTEFQFVLDAASTLHDLGVKLVDPYGGESSVASTTATTGTAGSGLVAPSLLYLIQGDTGAPVFPRSETELVGYGVQLGVVPSSQAARIRLQMDTSDTFPDPDEILVAAGTREVTVLIPLDGTTRYFRVRHEADGLDPSSWTDDVSAAPTALYVGIQSKEFDTRVVLALSAAGMLVSLIGDGVGADNGTEVLPLARGYESGAAAHGASVVFTRSFASAPMVVVTGGKVADGTYADRVAEDVSAAGFTMRAANRTVSSLTAQTDLFAAGTATTVGASVECNLDPAGASGGEYTVQYDVTVDVSLGVPEESVTVVVAIDSDDGSGWVERATRSYWAPGGDTGTWPNQTVGITVSGLGLNDDIRVRIKSITKTGGSSIYSVSVDPDQVDYLTDSGGSEASATPDTGETARWQALEVG